MQIMQNQVSKRMKSMQLVLDMWKFVHCVNMFETPHLFTWDSYKSDISSALYFQVHSDGAIF